MFQSPQHLVIIPVIRTEIQVPADAVLFLINEVIQKDVEPLYPGKEGLSDTGREVSGTPIMKGGGNQAEDAERRTAGRRKFKPADLGYGCPVCLEPFNKTGNALFRGDIGQPVGGFPHELQQKILV